MDCKPERERFAKNRRKTALERRKAFSTQSASPSRTTSSSAPDLLHGFARFEPSLLGYGKTALDLGAGFHQLGDRHAIVLRTRQHLIDVGALLAKQFHLALGLDDLLAQMF